MSESGTTGYKTDIVLNACRDVQTGKDDPDPARFSILKHVASEIVRLDDEELFDYIFYRYRYDIFPVKKMLDEYPPCLQVEVSSTCNYRCVFCYQTDEALTKRENGHMGMMSLNLFKRIIDQAEGNIEAITLASRGEPLLNKEMEKMLACLAGKFLALKVNTNASCLTERLAHAILQAGVNTVVFSADAASEPLYSQMRVNGRLDKVLANIRGFQKVKARDYPHSRTITRISGVKFRAEQNMNDMRKQWGELADQVVFVDYNPWENTSMRAENQITTPCSDLWRRMFVWWDGKTNPCDVDYLSKLQVGDANEVPISKLWTGPVYAALREVHLSGKRGQQQPCARCTVI